LDEIINEHMNSNRYYRYHVDVFWPDYITDAVAEFLPYPGTPLPTSLHYREQDRNLPQEVIMPHTYDVIEATVVKDTLAIFRVMIRFRWNRKETKPYRQSDLVLVLDGDFELVTGYWRHPGKDKLEDISVYENEDSMSNIDIGVQ